MNKVLVGILGAIAVCVSHAGAPDMEDEWTDNSPVQMTEPNVVPEAEPIILRPNGLNKMVACQAFAETNAERYGVFIRDLSEGELEGFRLFSYVSCLELALLLQ